MSRFIRDGAIQLKAKFALANLMRSKRRDLKNSVASFKSDLDTTFQS